MDDMALITVFFKIHFISFSPSAFSQFLSFVFLQGSRYATLTTSPFGPASHISISNCRGFVCDINQTLWLGPVCSHHHTVSIKLSLTVAEH